MSTVQEIDLVLRPNGSVEIKVRGVPGAACLDITRKLEAELGNRIVAREHTDELHQTAGEEIETETHTKEG
jgi:hypothetical protein